MTPWRSGEEGENPFKNNALDSSRPNRAGRDQNAALLAVPGHEHLPPSVLSGGFLDLAPMVVSPTNGKKTFAERVMGASSTR